MQHAASFKKGWQATRKRDVFVGGGGCLGMFKDQGNHSPLSFQSYVFAFLKCNVNRNQA